MNTGRYIHRADDSIAFVNRGVVFALRKEGVWRWADASRTKGATDE